MENTLQMKKTAISLNSRPLGSQEARKKKIAEQLVQIEKGRETDNEMKRHLSKKSPAMEGTVKRERGRRRCNRKNKIERKEPETRPSL